MVPTRLDRRQWLAGTLASSLTVPALTSPGLACRARQSDDGDRRRVLFFTKSSGFEHSVVRMRDAQLGHAERTLIHVGGEHGFDVVASKDGRLFDEDLEQWDAFVFYTTGDLTQPGNDGTPAMSRRGKERLLEAVHSGKGFVGSHCASDTFHSRGDRRRNQDEKDPYIAMLGGEFISHGPQQSTRMTCVDAEFPGMEPASPHFNMHEEWYSLKNFADDLHVLLVNETAGMNGKDYERPPYPATWARRHGEGRVFYTSMGHREDVWTNPIFQSVLVGGIQWAMGVVDAEVPPNLDEVTPRAHINPPA